MALAICKGVTSNLSWPIPMVTIVHEFHDPRYSLSYAAVSGTFPPFSLGRSIPVRRPRSNAFKYSFHFVRPVLGFLYLGLSTVNLNVLLKNELHDQAIASRRFAACPGKLSVHLTGRLHP